MGQYLVEGVALGIYVRKQGKYSLEDVKANLKEEVNLDLYNITEDESNVYFSIKKQIFMDNLENLLRNEYKDLNLEEEEYKIFDDITGLSFQNLIKKLKELEIDSLHFRYTDFGMMSNSINYLSKDREMEVYVEMLAYNMDGKIIMECFNGFLRYFRRKIISSIKDNPLKDNIFVTIYG